MKRLAATVALLVVLATASPALAHTCGHNGSTFTRIGTTSQYYKWYKDSKSPEGHFTNVYNFGSNGYVYAYTHGHVPADSACPGHYYIPGTGDTPP